MIKKCFSKSPLIGVLILILTLSISPPLFAAFTTNFDGGGSGDNWSTSANWDNGEPAGDFYRAYIGFGDTVEVTNSGEHTGRLYIGVWYDHAQNYAFAGTGHIHMVSGNLKATLLAQVGGQGVGTVNQEGGTFDAKQLNIGANAIGASGEYNITGGKIISGGAGSGIGIGSVSSSNPAIFNQSGTAEVQGQISVSSNGVYNLSGSNTSILESSGGLIQNGGIFNQMGGVHTLGGEFKIQTGGLYEISDGTLDFYNISPMEGGVFRQTGGTMTTIGVSPRIDVHTGGTYEYTGGSLSGDGGLVIWGNGADGGTFTGRGTVGLTGTAPAVDPFGLRNSGKVIADGGGSEVGLYMRDFVSVTNLVANTADNGWYAENKGKLTLPGISITGDGTYVWGADASLINSVVMEFHGVTAEDVLEISLLDPTRSDIPSHPYLIFSNVWDIDLINEKFEFDYVDITVHYSEAELAKFGINEDALRFYRQGSWIDATILKDLENNTITGRINNNSLDINFFAIGMPVPEIPTSTIPILILGLLSGLFLIRKRLVQK